MVINAMKPNLNTVCTFKVTKSSVRINRTTISTKTWDLMVFIIIISIQCSGRIPDRKRERRNREERERQRETETEERERERGERERERKW